MTPHTKPVVFIGSPARDLPWYLNEALDVCLRLGIIPVVGEQPAVENAETIEAALTLVDECDVYIGIFGNRHGQTHTGDDKSLAELEYERALTDAIPRLVFTIDDDQPSPDRIDAKDGSARLARFIDRIKEKQTITSVTSVDEFRKLLTTQLSALGLRKGGTRKGSNVRFSGRQKTALRVFVASPRDVQDERSRMPSVVETLNKTIGQLLNVVVELWRWEVDAPPAVGEPQALVNPELDKADVVLVIFWNRFGTPTAAGPTGTEGEVLRALKRWRQVRSPQVMMYFCQRPALLDSTETEQRLKLLKFRDRISSLVLAVDYEKVEDFQLRVQIDLFSTISTLFVRNE